LDSLIVRQNNDNTTTSATPTQSSSKTAKTSASTAAGTNTASGGATTTFSATATGDNNGNETTATASYSTSFDARLPAGGVSMITPAVISGEQYFKIGDYVTFAWNYTSVLADPTYINVLATCTQNQQLYTIAANQTYAVNGTQAVTWDTGSYQATAVGDPLLTETYTLIILDAESSITAQAQAGYLAVYDQYTFGMYTPQPYTPLNEFQCATCSAALSDMERRALGVVIGMSVITVLSFTWFVGGTGVIW
jgi:hypothetical protein